MKILFDLDDTLYPERQYVYQGFWAVSNYIQESYKIDARKIYLELISIFKSRSKKVFDDLISLKGISEDPLKLVSIYRAAKRKLSLYSEVCEVLKLLKENNDIILITNGNSEVQRRKINILKLEDFFDDIFILDDFGLEYWKPSTLIFDRIYRKYQGDLSEYVFIGNGEEDLEFSRRLGIKFFLVKRRDCLRIANIDLLKSNFGIYVIDDLRAILHYLDTPDIRGN